MSLQKNAGAVKRFARLMRFAAWLQGLPAKLSPPPFRLLQIGSAFWQSRLLYVAARLDIATVLGEHALTAQDIAEQVGAAPDALHRLLRMLTAMGVFEQRGTQVFANNKVSAYLRRDHPNCLRDLILMHNSEVMSRPWYEHLEQGIRENTVPFELSHGQAFYDYMDSHPDFDALFARAMDSVEALTGEHFATDFDWSRFERVIDIGGSRGSKSLAILKHHPQLTALVVDRAPVIEGAAESWEGRVEPQRLARLRFEAGDLFGHFPQAAGAQDIYLLCAVLHGFDDAGCIQALSRLAEACRGTGARIALMEMVLDSARADLSAAGFDMQMFMSTRGRERSLEEWRALFEAAGLQLEELVGTQSLVKILLLRALP